MSSPAPSDTPKLANTAAALPPSPPLSAHADEPSPPVARILDALRAQHGGSSPPGSAPWTSFPLSHAHHRELVQRIRSDKRLAGFFNDKVRHDYDAPAERFVLRMPSALHDFFCSSVGDRIKAQLARVADSHPELRPVVERVRSGGSTTLQLDVDDDDDVRTTRSPDFQLHHDDARWPSLVIEISYSQKRKALPKLAYDYLRGSLGNIQAVVGLDVEYAPPGDKSRPGSQQAAVLVWRESAVVEEGETGSPVECSDVALVHEELFRDSQGDPASGALQLSLSDFAPRQVLEDLADPTAKDLPITVSYADLCTDLAAAEKALKRVQTDTGYVMNTGRRWRKRKATPPEELSDGTERKYRRLEEGDKDKAAAQDADFSGAERPVLPVRRRSARLSARSEHEGT
ncbi:hypothetical protein B0J12DRAFT_396365 [Macrophomina phaseolina]|uniref:Uncharacterized protein n=1 Tax=Macrophomina phaseolina TaxID=35725 RepID=A0ABQ8FRY8_9PEZI|nr:hypothetical protein B0J12DRAFT_396365 [Macrophomina phaseolina]